MQRNTKLAKRAPIHLMAEVQFLCVLIRRAKIVVLIFHIDLHEAFIPTKDSILLKYHNLGSCKLLLL